MMNASALNPPPPYNRSASSDGNISDISDISAETTSSSRLSLGGTSTGSEESYQKSVQFLTEMIVKSASLTSAFITSGHQIATSDSAKYSLINLPSVELAQNVKTALIHAELAKAIVQLRVLQKRVNDDRASILVTGDVNSGKSTLINAILGSDVCATDQLPSEDTFYQITSGRSSRELSLKKEQQLLLSPNNISHEVSNEITSESGKELVLAGDEEEELQVLTGIPSVTIKCSSQEKYTIIDSPGLNVSCQSTENLLRASEECDIIIPVLSADVGFSLSTTDFLSHAAREKRWLFIIVNKLDLILPKNVERAKKRILDQLHSVSPDTATTSNSNVTQLVHFISAADPQEPEWSDLKSALKDFVLNRRTMTKLSPAQTYMRNLLSDLYSIAQASADNAASIQAASRATIEATAPELSSMQNRFSVIDSKLDALEADTVQHIKASSIREFNDALTNIASETQIPTFKSWSSILDWSLSVKMAMLQRLDSVVLSQQIFIRSKVEHTMKEMNGLAQIASDKLIEGSAGNTRDARNLSAMFQGRSMCIGLARNMPISFIPLFLHSSSSSLVKNTQIEPETSLLGYLSVAAGGLTLMTSTNSFAVKALLRIASGRWAAPLFALTMFAISGWAIYTLPESIPRIIGYSLRSHFIQQRWVANEVNLAVNSSSKVLRSTAFHLRNFHLTAQKEQEHVLAAAQHSLHVSEAELGFYGSYLPQLIDCRHKLITKDLVLERKVLKKSLSQENIRQSIGAQENKLSDIITPAPTKLQRAMTSALVMRQ